MAELGFEPRPFQPVHTITVPHMPEGHEERLCLVWPLPPVLPLEAVTQAEGPEWTGRGEAAPAHHPGPLPPPVALVASGQ